MDKVDARKELEESKVESKEESNVAGCGARRSFGGENRMESQRANHGIFLVM